MKRRSVLHAAALAAWPSMLPAQTRSRGARIAFSSGAGPGPITSRDLVDPFLQGLGEAGFAEGRNLVVDYRFAEGRPERLPGQMAELLALRPDLILACGPAPALAAKAATATVPILAAPVDDPVLMGLVPSMARPGGNITGISGFSGELVQRRLQLLKDLLPEARRFAVLANPSYVKAEPTRALLAQLEGRLGVTLLLALASGPEQYAAAFATLARERIEGLVVLADSTTWTHRGRIGELILAQKLPSVWGGKDYLGEAGVASYQSDFPDIMRRAGAMAGRILDGARPAEIPFEQATTFVLALNLRAARTLGVKVPRGVLLSATDLIE
jgi:putative ABC transport system substrate-binding protein